MRVARLVAVVAGISGLAAAALAAPAVQSGSASSTASPLSGVVVRPGVIHIGRARAVPPTTADCEQSYKVACFQPDQIRQAYDLPALYAQGIDGKGVTIVIVNSFGSPTIKNDLSVFDKAFSLPAPPSFRVIQPAGKVPAYDAGNSDMVGWAGETTLDVEYAHVIAPDASIVLVETPVSETEGVHGFPQIVTAEEYVLKHHLGDVISQSFSATEQTFANAAAVQALRGAYQLAERDHVTVLAASGDSGAADVGLDQTTYYLHPVTSWPDSDPLVTGVGGTELVAGKGNTYTSVAWNDTYNPHLGDGTVPYATGGGLSVLFSRPFYQDGVKNVVGSARGVPDVSMSGACTSPVFTYQSYPQQGTPAGWYPACGTSESTPEFAGIVALADQVAGHPLGLINPRLYWLSAKRAPGIVPVTSGNNTVTFTQGTPVKTYTIKGFKAQAGYSLADGVGTVNGWYLAYELAGQRPW